MSQAQAAQMQSQRPDVDYNAWPYLAVCPPAPAGYQDPHYPVAPPLSPIHQQENSSVPSKDMYPSLTEYMGLEFTPELIAAHFPAAGPPPYTSANNSVAVRPPQHVAVPQSASYLGGMVAPLSGNSVGLRRAEVTHGVREVVLCKDASGKVGLRVKDVSKGVFVALVQRNSPAALGGLRFGDQILQINGENAAGYNVNKVHDIFKKCGKNNIRLAVRDRPFERTVTLHKDSVGHVGFGFKNGKINLIVKDSSAARNGLLIDQHLLEVNGQNVVGLKDKEVSAIIDGGGNIITVTIMPSFLYEHMIKNMRTSVVKDLMDHSIPEL